MSGNAHSTGQLYDCLDEREVTQRPHHPGRKRSQKQRVASEAPGKAEMQNCRIERPETSPASTSGRSNFDSFLECTTPTVQCQFLSKSSIRETSSYWRRGPTSQSLSFFVLGDLWDAFDEWSAYGAGVPLLLPGEELVVQYYVPYLSAVQIYARDSSDVCANHRRVSEESDFSDMDLRDTSSESSIENESNNAGRNILPGLNGSDRSWDASTVFSEDSDEGFYGRKNKRGQLVLEYFERSSPHGRAPFADKISELASQFTKLRTLRSYELSPASWVSVAWYPIYRIPTGRTMRDLGTCFLTFHSISMTCFQDANQDNEDNGTEEEESFIDPDVHIPTPFKIDEERVVLPAFGLASYKLRGALWASVGQTERRRVISLASCADSWLRQLDVHHPDFDFFVSHGAFMRR